MAVPDLPPPEARRFRGAEIRASLHVRAAAGQGEHGRELDDEMPPRIDVYDFVFARQIMVATSSASLISAPNVGGVTLVFRQVEAQQGLPYTWVYYGTLSTST